MNAVTVEEVTKDGSVSNQSKDKKFKVVSPFKSTLVWEKPVNVLANPHNPRTDYDNLGDITEILKTLNWCQPVTAYREGNNLILLSGHRRTEAAVRMGMKEIPVFIVEKPENDLEEMKRIRGLQDAHENLNPYDLAKLSVELYNVHHCKEIVAKEMNVSEGKIEMWLAVINFFSGSERKIAKGLKEKRYTINMLHNIVLFVKKLEKEFPTIVEDLSIDYIRGSLISKASKKQINSNLYTQDTLKYVSKNQLKKFLTTNLSLKDFRKEAIRTNKDIVFDYKVNNKVITTVYAQMDGMNLGTKSEMIKIKEYIEELLRAVKETKNKL